jgi:tetratricopeptide (TPR) repeat protein
MTSRLAIVLILTGILGCQSSPLIPPRVEELGPASPKIARVGGAPGVRGSVATGDLPDLACASGSIRPEPDAQARSGSYPGAMPSVQMVRPEPDAQARSASYPAPLFTPEMEASFDHLAEASRCIERDDLKSAAAQLEIYLSAKPDAQTVRVQYAEILASLNRRAEARGQFNQFLAIAQEQKTQGGATMIHVYRRLMEIAEEAHDEYGVHLNRGIGLYLLSQQRAQLGAGEQEMPVEGLLCKAAAELTLAHDERPDEAQVSWYLYQVWSKLGQRHPALVRLREAHDAAPFSYLSPAESRKLSMACLDSLTGRTAR